MLKIKSSNINKYRGKDKLDITVKSASGVGKYFAPTWDMVMDYKNKKINWDEYKEKYFERMRMVWTNHRWVFRRLFKKDKVCFVCYCKTDEHCHRRLLREILEKIANQYELELKDCGEVRLG